MSHISSVKYENGNLMNSESKLLCVGVYKDLSMTFNGSDIDQEFDGAISSAIKVGDIKVRIMRSIIFTRMTVDFSRLA